MKLSHLFLTLAGVSGLTLAAQGAIPVTGAGAGPLDFLTAPASPADFSTLSVGADAATYETTAALDAAIVANTVATAVVTALGTTATQPPSTAGIARHNTAYTALQTRPTGNDYIVLMATLQNNAGGDITSFTLTYDFGAPGATTVETSPGHRVFFSVTGAAGTWQLVPALSGLNANTPGASANISGLSWPVGANAYLLWVDDNSLNNPDGGYTIDNLAISGVSTVFQPTTIAITSPTNGQQTVHCADLVVATTTTGAITNVDFYVNNIFFTNDTAFPFGGTVMVPLALPLGDYTLTAVATDTTPAMLTSVGVSISIVANQPPVIAITNTLSGGVNSLTFLVGSPITVQASFSDDDAITNIEWQVDGVLSLTNRINNTWTYLNALAGTHTLRGIAIDRKGQPTISADWTITVTNPPATVYSLLITNGADWKYFASATGAQPDDFGGGNVVQWYHFNYNEAGWSAGLAELGNGDIPNGYAERTLIDIGPGTARYPSVYFRKFFNVVDPVALPVLSLRVLRDDGAIVWLNGVSVWTNNMATTDPDPVHPSTIANTNLAAGSDDGFNYQTVNLVNSTGSPIISAGPNIIAVQVHNQNATSSDLSFDLMLWGNLVGNTPPVVTVTNPAAGSNLMVGTFVDVGAAASDSDGTIARVEFYDNGVLRLTDTTVPYGYTLSDLTAGNHSLVAVAVDDTGASTTSAAVSITVTNPTDLVVVLTNGAPWKYLDNGTDQGIAWTALLFDDSGWSDGIADLGYGDGAGVPELTVVSFGSDAANKYVTTYFRKVLTGVDPSGFGQLRLDSLRDDGVVVHINGVEVFRNNFVNTAMPILFNNELADAAIGGVDESTYISTNIPSSVLVPGNNIIAVEIHQSAVDSSDISFDLMLWGAGPSLTITDGVNYSVSWTDASGLFKLQRSPDIGSPLNWSDVPGNPPSPYTQPLGAGPQFFRLLKP